MPLDGGQHGESSETQTGTAGSEVSQGLGQSPTSEEEEGDFPAGPGVKTASMAGGLSSISGRGTRIPHATWPKKLNKYRPRTLNEAWNPVYGSR